MGSYKIGQYICLTMYKLEGCFALDVNQASTLHCAINPLHH